ncbi:MerR family transcriptional regulator [Virgisporangium aliadipatigenens]|uniref:MerR family transcriptional regulator n=1 Tax=Virgisporangium aliadipatigenens TaxID=741659 RepID=A0A8J3YPT0_9ACTN|nr:MerR family transcriptional regulator [Virgisporangium aliadipatigenens]GIJ48093.1 MerR family transcriptional regulator [Virgisporangium aliadipatigenens]
MRIKNLAELAGTTVRTIRYYHQIGLLPVPPIRDGCRDYDLSHVARLARIRWLARAGLPLSRIGAVLSTPEHVRDDAAGQDAILVDLRATLGALDDQIEQLRAQREQVERLVAAVERGGDLSPVPGAVAAFYDDLARRATDDRVRRSVRRERDFMELAYYRGDMPPEAELVYRGFTETARSESLALFGEIAERDGATPTDAEIARMAEAVVARLRRQLGADLKQVARSVRPDIARRAADLYVSLTGDPASRRVARAVGDAVLALIEEEAAPCPQNTL